MSKIDPSLTRNDTTQVQLTRHKELIKFMKTHCQERAYSFQVCFYKYTDYLNFNIVLIIISF